VINWDPLRELVDAHQRFVLTCHVRPDADALGSQVALAEFLEAQGKSVRIVNPSPTPDHLAFLDPDGRVEQIIAEVSVEDACDTDVHVVLDTSAWGQLVEVGAVLKKTAATRVVIDHHVSSDDLEAVMFKDEQAEATGAMVFDLAESCGWEVSPSAASALYCAIATDTGWFRFSSTTAATMAAAGRLIDLGAEPHLLYRRLYERISPARLRLVGLILGRLEVGCNGRLAWLTVRQDDFVRTGAVPNDTEDVVNQCLRIEGVECAFIAIEQKNRRVKVSLRSRGDVDVANVAQGFGGGGHRQAAGATLDGPLDEAVTSVVTVLTETLASLPPQSITD